MAAEISVLKELITDGKIGEAITFLEKNKGKEPLKNAIKKDNPLLYLVSYIWVEVKGKDIDEPTLWSLWEMETRQFNSYIQWLPQEILEETFELAPIRTLFILLLNCGANLDQIHLSGNTPLILAVEHANLGLAQFLLRKGANINAQDKNGNTPLHVSIKCLNLQLARFLLQNGADINVQNSDGNTPLHLAIKCLDLELAQFLLNSGADINMQNNSGQSPLNAQNRTGDTPLHVAIECSNLRLAQFLLQNGSDINVQNNSGGSPLHIAVQKGNIEVMTQLVLKDSCNLNAQNKDGETPLHWAVTFVNIRIPRNPHDTRPLELLLANKANVNVWDKDGKTPLHWAVEWGVPSLVQLLLSNGADVNAQDKNGNTPLHLGALKCNRLNYSYPVSKNYLEIANLLLSYHAKATIKNHNGEIPLHCFPNYVPDPLYEGLENIKKVLSEKAHLEQKAKQPVSNAPPSINSASNSGISLNGNAFLQGIRRAFLKKLQKEMLEVDASPRLDK